MITQTNKNNNQNMRRYGCRVMCLMAIPQFYLGKFLTQEQTMEIIDSLKDIPGVFQKPDTYMTGSREDLLMFRVFDYFEEPYRAIQLGEIRKGIPFTWGGKQTEDFDYQIVHWKTDGADGHFTLSDKGGAKIYDPHDPKEAGYAINKREINRRLIYKVWRRMD